LQRSSPSSVPTSAKASNSQPALSVSEVPKRLKPLINNPSDQVAQAAWSRYFMPIRQIRPTPPVEVGPRPVVAAARSSPIRARERTANAHNAGRDTRLVCPSTRWHIYLIHNTLCHRYAATHSSVGRRPSLCETPQCGRSAQSAEVALWGQTHTLDMSVGDRHHRSLTPTHPRPHLKNNNF
jgi:hypothetical protein